MQPDDKKKESETNQPESQQKELAVDPSLLTDRDFDTGAATKDWYKFRQGYLAVKKRPLETEK
ncbi:MAG: hypothetical protein KGJ06_09005 [Pseudomonadota bacterium]|nr:hypothetical protein [Pseudomonadota bacterium]